MVVAAVITAVLTTTGVQAVTAPAPNISNRVEIKPQTISEKIDYYANLYKVNPLLMRGIVMCESSMNPNAIGDNGHSRGLVQIHDRYHPTISHQQAFDPDFSLDFLAKNMAKGNDIWTCWR